ncbi:protein JTB [Scyliorhinus torazame]|uniref:protein JTB n=1 Tax=Scyliorhinus torazame TaxID=75743 RepID=UPI003B5BCA8E
MAALTETCISFWDLPIPRHWSQANAAPGFGTCRGSFTLHLTPCCNYIFFSFPAVSTVSATRCWQVEQFMVAEECKKCTRFQVKTQEACGRTGFVEKINCSESQKEEYKSCRSTGMEETLFWRFEGTMVTLSVVFAVMVVLRQRTLDRLASEKVRKQIESI